MSGVFALIGFALFALRRLMTYLHLFQQEEYDNRRFVAWIIQNRAWDQRLSLALIAVWLIPLQALFPQMLAANSEGPPWKPHFMDYLFLAFNTSTAFSPTDTAALSRWAKVGMMTQSLISLTIVAFLAARAVNIL